MRYTLHLVVALLYFYPCAQAQKARVIAFWNLENLYDTINDPLKNDEDFLPDGALHWTGERYQLKLQRLSKVIAQLGSDFNSGGPSIIGVCEVENASVLRDLLATPLLGPKHYRFVLIEGPDIRGVDPALIYDTTVFHFRAARSFPVSVVTDTAHKTRNILLVRGEMDGENVSVLVNHWPSRRGGELASKPNRLSAARRARAIADSLEGADRSAKVIVMGDFNDDPVSESIAVQFGTYGNAAKRRDGDYFNPMEAPFRKGIGTLAWQDTWNLFDQILLSGNWLTGNKGTWQYGDVRIFNPVFLRSDHGNFKGYPHRTFSGGKYTAGYSDHFPSFIVIQKKS
jgi:hypothetical protein